MATPRRIDPGLVAVTPATNPFRRAIRDASMATAMRGHWNAVHRADCACAAGLAGNAGFRRNQAAQSARSIADRLPLFARNNCQQIRDPGNQLFCGDAELAAAAEKLAHGHRGAARPPARSPACDRGERDLDSPAQSRLRHRRPDRDPHRGFRPGEGLPSQGDRGSRHDRARSRFRLSRGQHRGRRADLRGPVAGAYRDRAQQPGARPDRQAGPDRGTLCLRRIRPLDAGARSQMQSGRQGERAAQRARLRGRLSRRLSEAQGRRDRARPRAIRRRCSAGRSQPASPTPTPSISAPRGFTPPIRAAISSASTASTRSTAR